MIGSNTTARALAFRLHNCLKAALLYCALANSIIGCSSVAIPDEPPPSVNTFVESTQPEQPQFPPRLESEAQRVAQRVVENLLTQTTTLERDLDNRIHIAVAPLTNRSTAPAHTAQLFSDRWMATLQSVGVQHGFRFEHLDEAPRALDAPYLLYGELFAIRKDTIGYWEFFLSLDELDPTGRQQRTRIWESPRGYLIRR